MNRTIEHKGITYVVTRFGVVSPFLARRGEYLGDAPEGEVQRAMAWLRECTTPHPRKRGYSYTLKHRAEEYTNDYVGNGSLIEAALRLGYRVTPEGPRSPNAWVWCQALKNLGGAP